MLLSTASSGWPFFSYMPNAKKGSMDKIMTMAAALVPPMVRIRKNRGSPTSAPLPKQISCRLVKLNMTLGLTRDRSLGTGTYAMGHLLING